MAPDNRSIKKFIHEADIGALTGYLTDNSKCLVWVALPSIFISMHNVIMWLGLVLVTRLKQKFLFVCGSDQVRLSTLNRVDLTQRMSHQANTFTVL